MYIYIYIYIYDSNCGKIRVGRSLCQESWVRKKQRPPSIRGGFTPST